MEHASDTHDELSYRSWLSQPLHYVVETSRRRPLTGLLEITEDGLPASLSGIFPFREAMLSNSRGTCDATEEHSTFSCCLSLSLQGCKTHFWCRTLQVFAIVCPLVLLWYYRRRTISRRKQFQREASMSMIAMHPPRQHVRSRTGSAESMSSLTRINRLRTESTSSMSSLARLFRSKEKQLLTDTSAGTRTVTEALHGDLDGDYSEHPFPSLIPALKANCRIHWQGPTAQQLTYKTMIPPPSWSDTSRRLLPHSLQWKLHREISLDLGQQPAMLSIRQARDAAYSSSRPTDTFSITANDIGIHVKPPVAAGVLELYVKDSPRDQWMEHSFQSAAEASQFQTDLLSWQFLGESIHRMYQAFEILHQGSCAYIGSETVLHDKTLNTENLAADPSGIAWDDVMRCLGMNFSTIRVHLEVIWRVHMTGTHPLSKQRRRKQRKTTKDTNGTSIDTNKSPSATSPNQNPDYEGGKRLLLGLVDFFRLFVPLLPEKSVPHSDSSPSRMEQLLRCRKRVAKAAILVQAYVRARTVVNQGWELGSYQLEDDEAEKYIQRRLAFDDNWDNVRRDISAKNEYYEASVSRDVICQVRGEIDMKEELPWWHLLFPEKTGRTPVLSRYQGYALVGVHTFQWQAKDQEYPLQPHEDPVLAIPSLRELIERNKDLDFFVHSFFAEGKQSAVIVEVFVRSLPKGIDTSFDRSLERFVAGDSDLRKRKLECVLQLGIEKDGLSFFAALLLSLLSFMLRVSLRGRRLESRLASARSRTTIPALNLSECGEAYHFGGALHKIGNHEASLPTNYFASNTHISSLRRNTLATRFLIAYMECGGLTKDVVDFTYIISGTELDEVPERALGTIRIVSSTVKSCALPICYIQSDDAVNSSRKLPNRAGSRADQCRQEINFDARLLFKVLIVDPVVVAASSLPLMKRSLALSFDPQPTASVIASQNVKRKAPPSIESIDPFEEAVNELIENLGGVTVPVKKEQKELSLSEDLVETASNDRGFVQTPVLHTLRRCDIRRYLVASDGSLKVAAVRIVQSAAWRGMTFPIDLRTCRVELQSGTFFQQGNDLEGNPVFYFRNSCLGPWRKNEDATIAAVLHRLETSLENLERKSSSAVQCTLIVVMGRPSEKDEASVVEDARSKRSVASDDDDDSFVPEEATDEEDLIPENNPRIHSDEKWHAHTSKRLVLRLIDILLTHYPERLSKALVVLGYGNKTYMRTVLRGRLALSVAVHPPRTRERVRFLKRYKDLQRFVSKDTLVKLVGGNSSVLPSAFDCR